MYHMYTYTHIFVYFYFICVCVCIEREWVILFPLGKYPEVKLMDHILLLILYFHQQCTRVLFTIHPHQCLLFSIFLKTAILTVVRWYFIVDLIYIYMMTSDVEYLSMYLLDSSVPFLLEKCLFRSSAYFYCISFSVMLYPFFSFIGQVTALKQWQYSCFPNYMLPFHPLKIFYLSIVYLRCHFRCKGLPWWLRR